LTLFHNKQSEHLAGRGQSEERWLSFLEADEHEGLKRITGISGANGSEMVDLLAQHL
jgi:hypothetical protein